MNRSSNKEDYETFKRKHEFLLDYVIGSVMECKELYDSWNRFYKKFIKIYIPVFLVCVYAAPFLIPVALRRSLSETTLSLFPIAQKRYDSLLGMGDQVMFWYISSLLMFLPSIAIISLIYIKLYAYNIQRGHNSAELSFKKLFGSIIYTLTVGGFFYFILFFPFPIEEKTSVPLMQFWVGPGFPILASGVSVSLSWASVPMMAMLTRVFVRKNDR
ncbi:hypothetical protein CLV41_11751 [Roseibium marinum]|uniref:Uncharacterized protein n=1 Tax=Roseibium marinum TaxID=281252 RepID=A0A2S3UK95_9HYPH|nr:hypothetical protein CLV41_11751 [Roseibium marinum]